MASGVAAGREVRRQFWLLVRAGMMRRPAAVSLGLDPDTGRDWFRQAGGVIPAFITKLPSGRFLSFAEREELFAGVERGDSLRRMARELDRAPSTVWRELRRNMRQPYRARMGSAPRRGRPWSGRWDYRPSRAQARAERWAARPKPAKLATNGPLRQLVEAKLRQQLSPQQVAVELREEFADNPEMQVSHETIYQSIYVQGRGALRRELAVHLRTGRAVRRPRRNVQERLSRIPGMVNISERPSEVQDRAVPGHWEGDLILGKNRRSAIGTLVERSTRFVMLLHLPDRHGPEEVQPGDDRGHQAAAEVHLEIVDLGPGHRDAQPRRDHDRDRTRDLLLRPGQALAARLQRKHQRPAAAVFPQGHRPQPAWTRLPGLRGGPDEPSTPRDARLAASRASARPPILNHIGTT